MNLPGKTAVKTMPDYGLRAAGEECLHRGFQYFDGVEIRPNSFEGFCFNSATRKSLAFSFLTAELKESHSHFIVENLNNKTNSQILKADEITSIDGMNIDSSLLRKFCIHSISALTEPT